MASKQRKGSKGLDEKPASLKDAFKILASKTSIRFMYDYDETVEARALRLDECERIVSLLKEDKVDVKCAAAYVIGRLGIEEARPVLENALKRARSPVVKYMFEFALASFDVMREFHSFPKPEEQLPMLLKMRESDNPVECKLADIVLEKADIWCETVDPEEPKQ